MKPGISQKISSSSLRTRAQSIVRNAGIAIGVPVLLSVPLFKSMAPKGWEEVVPAYLVKSLLPRSAFVFDVKEKAQEVRKEKEIDRKMGLLGPHFRIAGITHLLLSGAIFAVISRHWKKKDDDIEIGEFIRGVRLVSNEHLQDEITAEVKARKTDLEYRDNDLVLFDGKIRIPTKIGAGNFGLFGNSGTGKSQVIDSIVRQRRSHGEKGIIVDPGGLFYAKHGKPGDRILSLYDTRAEHFSFWAEQVSYIPQAQVLIEDSGNETSFWSKAGQALFAGILTLAKDDSDIWDTFFVPFDDLKKRLAAKKHAAAIALGEEKTSASVFAVASVDLFWIEHLNHWPRAKGKKEPFSITDWVNDNDTDSWVFLIDERQNWEMSRHLVRLWFEIATLISYQRGESKKNVPIWCICDEIATVGKLEQIVTILQEGRKFGLHLVLGSQDPAQLEKIYGVPMSRTIMSALQNYILFRSTDAHMTKIMSDLCGSSEREQVQISTNLETNSQSHSTRKVMHRNVIPDEFSALPNLEAYLKLSSKNPTKVSITYEDTPKVNTPTASRIPNFQRRFVGAGAAQTQAATSSSPAGPTGPIAAPSAPTLANTSPAALKATRSPKAGKPSQTLQAKTKRSKAARAPLVPVATPAPSQTEAPALVAEVAVSHTPSKPALEHKRQEQPSVADSFDPFD